MIQTQIYAAALDVSFDILITVMLQKIIDSTARIIMRIDTDDRLRCYVPDKRKIRSTCFYNMHLFPLAPSGSVLNDTIHKGSHLLIEHFALV